MEGAQPAWKAFAATQQVSEPLGCVTQPEHARLAGLIARSLRPEPFGVLSEAALAAIALHDQGWETADTAQLKNRPESFLALSPDRAIPCWRESIDEAARRSTLEGVLTSRHFCLLADDSKPEHKAFVEEETARRLPIEAQFDPAELDRYTAALGFCDLFSLWLAAGSSAAVELPLAHPASPHAAQAGKVRLQVTPEGSVQLDPELLRPGTLLRAKGVALTADQQPSHTIDLIWSI